MHCCQAKDSAITWQGGKGKSSCTTQCVCCRSVALCPPGQPGIVWWGVQVQLAKTSIFYGNFHLSSPIHQYTNMSIRQYINTSILISHWQYWWTTVNLVIAVGGYRANHKIILDCDSWLKEQWKTDSSMTAFDQSWDVWHGFMAKAFSQPYFPRNYTCSGWLVILQLENISPLLTDGK